VLSSLCGGLETGAVSVESFERSALSFEQFLTRLRAGPPLLEVSGITGFPLPFIFIVSLSDPSPPQDPALVIRLHEKYLSWPRAAPVRLSVILFRQPLPQDVVEGIVKDGLDVNVNLSAEEVKAATERRGTKSTWFGGWWAKGNPEGGAAGGRPPAAEVVKEETEEVEVVVERQFLPEEETEGEGEVGESRRCKKTLRLSSEHLAELNLQAGSNEVQFGVTTAFQGTTLCRWGEDN
jgi:phosphatidate phosphatase LPIN